MGAKELKYRAITISGAAAGGTRSRLKLLPCRRRSSPYFSANGECIHLGTINAEGLLTRKGVHISATHNRAVS